VGTAAGAIIGGIAGTAKGLYDNRQTLFGGASASTPAPTGKAGEIREMLAAAGITDPVAQANILAQIQAESRGKPQSENLNYSASRLLQVFPSKFSGMDDAQQVATAGPEAIGNRIYGGRMGNAPDEGYKYRGRGLIQLTGKDNYRAFSKLIGEDLVNNPDLVNDPLIAQKVAVAYFLRAQQRGTNLSDIASVGKAVGYVDHGGKETAHRAQLAQSIQSSMPKARAGGIFSGSDTGFPVELHGNELVAPLDPNSILAKMLTASPSEAASMMPGAGSSGVSTEMIEAMIYKFDTMISYLSEGVDIQQKILRHSS
jgi:putative chitinase